jgi:hypothetical protein
VINAFASNTTIDAFYTSGSTDLPGRIQFIERDFGGSAFSFNCSSGTTIGQNFFPSLSTSPTVTTNTTSVALTSQNRFYYSKLNEFEATTALGFFDVGARNFPILRVLALRDSTIIIKAEGAYRLTGDSPTSFNIVPIDLTIKSKAVESFVTLANQVYGLTDQGIVAVNETGVTVVSRDIEQDIIPILPLNATVDQAYAISYESDRTYIVSVPLIQSDTTAVTSYVFNVFTKKWTQWPFGILSGIVSEADDKLYKSLPNSDEILKERKNFNNSDYLSLNETCTIVSIVGPEVTITGFNPQVGWLLSQVGTELRIVAIAQSGSNFVCTLESEPPISWAPGAAILLTAINFQIQFYPWHADQPNALKLVRQVKVLSDNININNSITGLDVTIETDASPLESTVTIETDAVFWGSAPWGVSPWGGVAESYAYPTWPPKDKCYVRTMTIGINHNRAGERISIAGYGIEFEFISGTTNR